MNVLRCLLFFSLILWRESKAPYILAALLMLCAVCMAKCSGSTVEEIEVTVTAYAPGIQNDGTLVKDVTMIGVPTTWHGIAADFSQFPIGTRIEVPGYGWASVDDACGASRKAHRRGKQPLIDIRFATVDEANQWGRKTLRIKVKKP